MELSTHAKGTATELAVEKAFIEQGFGVSVPLLPTSRYDMIADIDGNLFKVQIKTARKLKNSDAFKFSLHSSRTHRWGVVDVRYNDTDVDMFATYYDGNVYIIPQYMVAGKANCTLRFSSASGQQKSIRFAEDFRFDNVVERWRAQQSLNNSTTGFLDYYR